MKIFSWKTLCRLRYTANFLLLAILIIAFSGIVLPWGLSGKLPAVQFMPVILRLLTISGAVALAILLILLLISILCGRFYCTWICPLGILQDWLERLNNRIFRRKPRKYEPALTWVRWSCFALFIACLSSGLLLPGGFMEPYSLFGKIASGVLRQLMEYLNISTINLEQSPIEPSAAWRIYLTISASGFIILLLIAAIRGRIFCNTVCPVGFILAQISRKSVYSLQIDRQKCVKCQKCVKACNAHCISINANANIEFDRCFMCLECLRACPTSAISIALRSKKTASADSNSLAMPERRRVILGAGAIGTAAFLGGKLLKKTAVVPEGAIAPPGASSAEDFIQRCTNCGLCMANCRGGCLQPATVEYGWRGFMLPVMKFDGTHPGKCEYECNNCMKNCPTGALKPIPLAEKKLCRIGMARFYPNNCLAYQDGEPCGACAEHCPTGALKMVPGPHEFAAVPQVIKELCIGCGNCQFACPVTPQAIRVSGVKKQSRATAPSEYNRQKKTKKAPKTIPF